VVGHPDLGPAEEKAFRRKVVERAIQAISTEVGDQQVF
jgi:hypothetical protein